MKVLNWKLVFTTLLFCPIFISVGTGNIGLDRVGEFSYGGYLFTLPISFFIAVFFLVSSWKAVLSNKYIFLFLLYSVFIFVVNAIYNMGVNYSIIKILLWMNVFIMMIYVFKKWFEKIIITDRSYNGVLYLNKVENRYVYYPLFAVLLLSLVSYFYIGKYAFVVSEVKIYNFEQYFSFIFVILASVSFKNKFFLICIVFPSTLFLSVVSSNITALFLLMFLSVFGVVNMLVSKKFKVVYFFIITSTVVFFLLWPMALYFLYDDILVLRSSNSLVSRYDMINGYFSNIYWYQIIFPFFSDSRSVSSDMHNELLEVFNATGFLGVFFYYYFILKNIVNYTDRYRMIGISIVLVIFLAGVTVENTLHPYLLIILAYVISFYNVMSRCVESVEINKIYTRCIEN